MQLGPRGVEGGQLGQPRLDLGRQAALLDDPGEERGDRPEQGDLPVVEGTLLAGLDVEDTDHRVVPFERHRQHPGEGLDVEAADPREPLVDRDVLDRDRGAARSDASGDALAPAEADPADLRAVEAVGRGEGQPHPFVVGEVERADVDAHRGRRAVDDRAHQLVPVARERRELGDVVEEGELVEPPIRVVSVVRRRVARGGFVGHLGPGASDLPLRQSRDLIAQRDQVVVVGRVPAELLLVGECLTEERPRDVEVAAERVEAGEVVAGVGGGTRRPTAAVDDRGDLVGEFESPRSRGRPRPRSVSGG